MAVALTTRRFTVEEYHRMAEVGILTDEDRVELIDGEIVEMTPVGARHGWCVMFLNEFFVKNLADRALVSPQGPLRLGPHTQLQPDLALLRLPRDAYRNTVPTSADVLLVIVVAETSLERDRAIKLPQYAALGVLDQALARLARRHVAQPEQADPVVLAKPIVVGRALERQRQEALLLQVGLVDPGEAADDDRRPAQEPGTERGVLAARALAV